MVGSTVVTNAELQGVISNITEEVLLFDVSNTHLEGQINANAQISIGSRKIGTTKASKNVNIKK
jgi:hypothetical protein